MKNQKCNTTDTHVVKKFALLCSWRRIICRGLVYYIIILLHF